MKSIVESDIPVIHHDDLIQRMMGSAQMAQRMLDKFVNASEIECDQLESIIRMGNADEIASLAHRHKGTARTMAALRVAQIAHEIESRAHTDPTLELLDLVAQLRASHREVREQVDAGCTENDARSEQC